MDIIRNLPDTDDKFIGEAILLIMIYFMYVWITSAASPFNFNGRANVALLVGHLEVILIVVIPIALLGLVQQMTGRQPRTRSSAFAQGLSVRAKHYRLSHTASRYVREKKKEETATVK